MTDRRISKETDAGLMHTTIAAWITCYDIFTKAGFYRGGKVYFADKIVRILSGEAHVHMVEEGEDILKKLFPHSWEFVIQSWIPNLFYFPKDTRMLEWFPEWTKAQEYSKYREMKK